MSTRREKCWVCRGHKTLYGATCRNCGGNGYVVTEIEAGESRCQCLPDCPADCDGSCGCFYCADHYHDHMDGHYD